MLTDKEVRNAAAREKPYKMAGSGSFYLYVETTGLKFWRMKFRLHGKEKLLTFGPYLDVKLTEARDKRDEAAQDPYPRRQRCRLYEPSRHRIRAACYR